MFQIIAAGRPVITLDSPAIRELLSPASGCTYLVPAGNPRALADAVMVHHRKILESGTPARCHQELNSHISSDAIGQQFLEMIQRRLAEP
ncbi:hypothetical protein TI01_0904 [Lysobacter sp. A03]|nr:hypothetical protein TI01_0904 [Lysobacter sp. A03]